MSSSKSHGAHPGHELRTFLKIFTNPHSTTTPITPIGADHLQTITNFVVKWQAGKVKDLSAAVCSEVDKQIDAKIKQAGKGSERAVSICAGSDGRGFGPGPAGA